MKNLSLLLIIAMTFISCNIKALSGNKPTSGKTHTETHFNNQTITGIDANSMFRIKVVSGGTNSVTTTVSEELKDHITVKLDNDGTLHLGVTDNHLNKFSSVKLEAEVVCTSLNKIDLSGMTHLEIQTPIQSKNLDIEVSGMSNISTNGAIKVDGNCKAEVNGMSQASLELDVSGNTSFDVSGMSRATIKGTSDKISLQCSGMSTLDTRQLSGQVTTSDVSGMSSIHSN